MVGYVCFGVGFACAGNVVGDRVVDGPAAYVACPTPPAYVVPHAGLYGATASGHVSSYGSHSLPRGWMFLPCRSRWRTTPTVAFQRAVPVLDVATGCPLA